MKNHKSYETNRLLLKPTTVEDANFFLELYNTPDWIKFIGDRNIKTIEAAATFIREKIMPQFDRLGYSNYTVILKSANTKIGSCGLYDREGLEGVDLGFAFLPKYYKQGYGYESATKVKELAFQQFSLSKLQAITVHYNAASVNLLKKLGFQFVKNIYLPNDPNDPEEVMLFELNKPDANFKNK